MDTRVTVRVFGGVRVWVDGAEVAVPNVRAGELVAALVVARGGVVATGDLVEFLWGAAAPVSAGNQLHRLVGQVRRMFEPGLPARVPGAFIAGSGVGYSLDPSRVDSDLARCDAAVAAARERARGGEWVAATEEYVRALRLVRSPVLGDVAAEVGGSSLLAEAARVRVLVAQEALECAQRCGRLVEVTGLVEQVAAPLPFEEHLQAALVRALGRSGRRRDAMALYERVRRGLVEELGVDPGAELRAAHEELLAIGTKPPAEPRDETPNRPPVEPPTEPPNQPPDDREEPSGPREAATRAGDADGSGVWQAPAELPARVRGFTPRPEAQRLLDEIAARGEAGAVLITAIGGMGGIGKTALAVAWARDLAKRFPDGQLYVNLRGFDAGGRVMSPEDALNHLLASVGAEKSPAVESLEARAGRFRSMTAGRAMLVLLDNARDAEQVRPLLPGHEGTLVIVTSRNQLSGLVVHEGAVPVRLDRMDDEHARQLLVRRVGADRVGSDGAALDRIVGLASGLPLALSIVAARLVLDPQLTLAQVADELTSGAVATPGEGAGATGAPDRLLGYSAGGDDLASVFAWSYELLEPEEAHTFRVLAMHPGSEMSLASIATLAGLDLPSARRVVDRLVAASLLEQRAGWFLVHDLLREYALSLVSTQERADAELRLVAHYVQTTRNAWGVYGRAPVGELDALVEEVPVQAEVFAGDHEAVNWYLHERYVLIAALHLAVDRGRDRAAANIAIDWRPMNQTVDTDDETYPHARTALEAASRTGDDVLVAELHRDLGPKLVRLGRPTEGRAHLEEAQALYERLGDPVGQANVLRNLSMVLDMPMPQRVRLLRAALGLVPEDLAPNARAVLMSDLAQKLTVDSGSAVVDPADYLEGESLIRSALHLARSHAWTDRIPEDLFALTRILMLGSRPREALEVAADALRLDIVSPAVRAAFLIETTKAAAAVGDMAAAVRSYREARDVVERVGASRLRQLVAAKLKFERYDVVEQLDQLERLEGPDGRLR